MGGPITGINDSDKGPRAERGQKFLEKLGTRLIDHGTAMKNSLKIANKAKAELAADPTNKTKRRSYNFANNEYKQHQDRFNNLKKKVTEFGKRTEGAENSAVKRLGKIVKNLETAHAGMKNSRKGSKPFAARVAGINEARTNLQTAEGKVKTRSDNRAATIAKGQATRASNKAKKAKSGTGSTPGNPSKATGGKKTTSAKKK